MRLRTILIIVLAAFSYWMFFLFSPVVKTSDGVIYYLHAATSKQALVEDLTQRGIITHPWLFALFAYPQKFVQLKTGEYYFPKGSTPFSIWKQLATGTGHYYRSFTIVPGWTFSQLRNALLQTETLRHNTKELNDNQIMAYFSNKISPPEGQFFPETYFYTRGVPDLVILKRAYTLMQQRLDEAWNKRADKLPYKNIYEALIAASLIEKEAFLDSERPVIAGVLVNRLRKHMLLQFDPTVIYGLGNHYTGKIHKSDLQEKNAYNTYVHVGLPPTPIAMPGMVSINAALHPQEHDYYYFVATGNGSHQFSRTLPEHNAAVAASIKHKSAMRRMPTALGAGVTESHYRDYVPISIGMLQ